MSYEIARLTDRLFAVAIWDDEYHTYNNCYVLNNGNEITLIDSGKAAHAHILVKTLTQLDILPAQVSRILITHGHKDHIGGAVTFANAERLLPEPDLYLIPDPQKPLFRPLPDNPNYPFIAIPLGHHTKGHTGFYHQMAKALFCGDFLTFYGEAVQPNGLAVTGEHLVEKALDAVERWLASPAVQTRFDTSNYRQGLRRMADFEVEHLCTGHGPVLKGKLVQGFLHGLAKL